MSKPKRILFYTNNSVGLGHTSRTLAIIKALRKIAPSIDFLVVCGTDIPQVFLQNGIEAIKLPSTKIVFDSKGQKLVPRYLNCKMASVLMMRQEIIKSAFFAFNPDLVIVEHNITGQGWELIPILIEKWRDRTRFKLFFVTRGVIDSPKRMRVNYTREQHLIESIDVPSLYDQVFVLDSKKNIDYSQDYSFEKSFCSKISYLGMITTKNKQELRPSAVRKRLDLDGKKLILVSVGRVGAIYKIVKFAIRAFSKLGKEYLLKIQIDPYLEKKTKNRIVKACLKQDRIRISHYAPDLIEEINVSELVVSRAGYNTVAEILLTNAKAILFPEVGRTEEEVYRSKNISKGKNIMCFDERKVTFSEFEKAFTKLLKARKKDYKVVFDNEAIAKKMIQIMRREG